MPVAGRPGPPAVTDVILGNRFKFPNVNNDSEFPLSSTRRGVYSWTRISSARSLTLYPWTK
ncbi:hypothetical protein EMIT0158MI4_20396 [Burkholderia ambifaria]